MARRFRATDSLDPFCWLLAEDDCQAAISASKAHVTTDLLVVEERVDCGVGLAELSEPLLKEGGTKMSGSGVSARYLVKLSVAPFVWAICSANFLANAAGCWNESHRSEEM